MHRKEDVTERLTSAKREIRLGGMEKANAKRGEKCLRGMLWKEGYKLVETERVGT